MFKSAWAKRAFARHNDQSCDAQRTSTKRPKGPETNQTIYID